MSIFEVFCAIIKMSELVKILKTYEQKKKMQWSSVVVYWTIFIHIKLNIEIV